jgi:hypothetical protein
MVEYPLGFLAILFAISIFVALKRLNSVQSIPAYSGITRSASRPKRRIAFAAMVVLLLVSFKAHAEDVCCDPETFFKVGYGTLSYKEKTSAFGDNLESDAKMTAVLLEGGKRYHLSDHYYLGFKIAVGGVRESDREEWTSNGLLVQTNDLSVSGPLGIGLFYPQAEAGVDYYSPDSGFGTRLYLAGGYDMQVFKRTRFYDVATDTVSNTPSYEFFQLPRLGVGVEGGYEPTEGWGIFAGLQYDRIFSGKVTNSLVDASFSTEGQRGTASAGLSYSTGDYLWRIGAQYMNISLDGSGIKLVDGVAFVFPDSESQLLMGFVELSY